MYNKCYFQGIDINYQILMTNGPPGDYWQEHFSADEFCKQYNNIQSYLG